jgi:SAM-dependent methyltransferase
MEAAVPPLRCCPLCGASDLAPGYRLDVAGTRLAQCTRCDVLVRREVPGAQPAPSWSFYGSQLGEYREDTRGYLERTARRRLALVREAGGMAGQRLLEVGPGSGEFLRLACEAGFAAEGLEPSPEMAHDARTRSGCTVHELPFERFSPAAAFAWIVMWHVFEHLDEPRSAVASLSRLIAPGGRLALIVPNGRGWVNRSLGGWAPSFAQQDHLYLYSPGALRALVAERFHVETVRTSEPPENAFSTFYALLGRRRPLFSRTAGSPAAAAPIGRGRLRHWIRQSPLLLGRALAPFTWPLRRLAEASGAGHEVWLVARSAPR